MHCHKHKWNAFYVFKGKLEIVTKKNDYDLVDRTFLTDGDFTLVRPNEYHQFHAHLPTSACELYFPEGLSEDIVRDSVGGMVAGKPHQPKRTVMRSSGDGLGVTQNTVSQGVL